MYLIEQKRYLMLESLVKQKKIYEIKKRVVQIKENKLSLIFQLYLFVDLI